MPAIVPGSKVLVTGANGFAAIHIVDALLKKGYSVRATIRSESKGTYLKKLFEKYGDKLELVVVPDITKVSLVQDPVRWDVELNGWDSRMAPSMVFFTDSMLFCIPPLPSTMMLKIQTVRISSINRLGLPLADHYK